MAFNFEDFKASVPYQLMVCRDLAAMYNRYTIEGPTELPDSTTFYTISRPLFIFQGDLSWVGPEIEEAVVEDTIASQSDLAMLKKVWQCANGNFYSEEGSCQMVHLLEWVIVPWFNGEDALYTKLRAPATVSYAHINEFVHPDCGW